MCTNFGLSNLIVILAKESKLAAPGTKKAVVKLSSNSGG
jgi:hypothetical protein